MAKDTTTAAKAPAAPAPKPDAPAPAAVENGKKGKKREQLPSVFPTAEAAIEAAGSRTKGPRRPFTCTTKTGEVYFVVGHNEGRAGGIAFGLTGGKVEELGKVRKTKVVGVDGILAALGVLTPEDRAKVEAQLAAMTGAKK